ncbi:MAG: AAA family ATPase [Nitrospira sp.]|nr:AAA family ATPase [Nitrospira sp.]
MVRNAETMEIPERNSFLLVGPPGAGKSTQIFTLPAKPFIFGFDANIEQAIRGAKADYELVQPDRLDINIRPIKKARQIGLRDVIPVREPRAYNEFLVLYEKLWNNGTLDKYPIWWFDSFSTFSDMVMDQVQYVNGRTGQVPERLDYHMQMFAIHNVARDAAYKKKILIATAHEKEYKKEKSPDTWQLALTGDLRLKIPLLFSNIFRLMDDRGSYKIITKSDKAHRYVRNSIRGLPVEFDTTILNWQKPQAYGLGRILVEAGFFPGPTYKTKLIDPNRPVVATKPTQPDQRRK